MFKFHLVMFIYDILYGLIMPGIMILRSGMGLFYAIIIIFIAFESGLGCLHLMVILQNGMTNTFMGFFIKKMTFILSIC